MEDNFRNVLIILSAIIITAIFIHGLWTIRKEKNPYKLKTSKSKVDPIKRDFDQKGFDQDGVSQVKVRKNTTTATDEEIEIPSLAEDVKEKIDLSQSQAIEQEQIFSASPEDNNIEAAVLYDNEVVQEDDTQAFSELDNSIEDDWFKEVTQADSSKENVEESIETAIEESTKETNIKTNNQFTKDELGDALTPISETKLETSEKKTITPKEPIEIEPLYEQPVTHAKPNRASINKGKKRPSKAELARDQMEIDFDNQPNVEPIKPKKVKIELAPEVIILSVVMPVNQQMFGAVLLPSLLTLGLKYGDMNIFHRHEDNAGNGKVTFSLANIMNPGSFDLDAMETFATRGVSLFMTLPNAGDSFAVFEQMLSAAKQLAQEFNAQVLDDKRNIMTKQTEQHYLNKIREFDRKNRIALAE